MEQLQLLPEFISNHVFLVGAFVVVLALLIKAEFEHQTSRGFLVDPTNAIRVMNNDDAKVIDVRSDVEYTKSHIKGARHIPAADILEKLKTAGGSKNDAILVYCNVGNQSARVCRALSKEGYTNIKNLKGGLTAWQEANLPVSNK